MERKIPEERKERNDRMSDESLKYNAVKNDEYFRNGGKTARYKEAEGGYFVFDGFEE